MQKNQQGLMARLKAWGRKDKDAKGAGGEQAAQFMAMRAAFLDKIKGILDGPADAVDTGLAEAVRQFVASATPIVQPAMAEAGKGLTLAAILKTMQDAKDRASLVDALEALDTWENVPRATSTDEDDTVNTAEIKANLEAQRKATDEAKAAAEANAKELEAAKAKIQKLEDEKRADGHKAKAKALALPVDQNMLASVFLRVENADAGLAKDVDTILTGLSAQWAKSAGIEAQLTTVKGSSGTGSTDGTASAELESAAQKMRAEAPADKPLTIEAARVAVLEATPGLYERIRKEQMGAA